MLNNYTNESIKKTKKRINLVNRTIRIIISLIIIPILIYNIGLIVKSIINPTKTPDFFGYKTFVVISGSMEPEIDIYDIVGIKEVDQNELEINDIIAFRQGQSIITHRIIEIKNEDGNIKYITKGDNNNIKDENEVHYSEIEGKLSFKIKKLGFIIVLLKNKIVLILVLVVLYMMYVNNKRLEQKNIIRKAKGKMYRENNKDESDKK